ETRVESARASGHGAEELGAPMNERIRVGELRMRKAARACWIATAVLGAIVLLAPAAGAITYALRGYVVGNGGGIPAGASTRIYGTLGQAAVGGSAGASNHLCHGFWCFGGSRVLAVEDPGGGCGCTVPTELSLSRAYPNPSRSEVRFELALPKSADVRLAVYDVSGRRVGEITAAGMSAGFHPLEGRAPPARAGVFFPKLYVGSRMLGQRRVVVVP